MMSGGSELMWSVRRTKRRYQKRMNVFEEDVFVKDEFEGRELSVVLEETEAEETCSEYESSTVDEVLFCSFHIVLSCVFFNYYPYYPR